MVPQRPPPHPLLIAASQGITADVCAELLKLGPGPLARAAHEGVDPLMLACANGRHAAVALLLRFGGFGLDPLGRNPLHYAARYNKPRCMRLLVKLPQAAAWAHTLDAHGMSPLHDACLSDSVSCTRILASLMDLRSRPELGKDAILHAASKGSSTAALWLLNLYPCLTTPSCAFLAACQSQDPESLGNFVKSLSSCTPAEKSELANQGLLIYCAIPFVGFYGVCSSSRWLINRLRTDDELFTRTLLALGANPLTRDPQGFTPLAHAVIHGHPGAAPLLLGLTLGALAPGRRSAARLARENNHLALADELACLQRTARLAVSLAHACSPALVPPSTSTPRL